MSSQHKDHIVTQNLSQNLSWVDYCSNQETNPIKKLGRPNKTTQREREVELNKKMGNKTVISKILKEKKTNKEGKDGDHSPSTHK